MRELSDQTTKHVEMIQRVAERMAGESARMKQLALASAAAVTTTATATSAWPLAIAGALLSFVFWGLDAKYLAPERWFRTLYNRTHQHLQTNDFTLTPTAEIRAGVITAETMRAWSVAWLYGALLVIQIVIAFAVGFT